MLSKVFPDAFAHRRRAGRYRCVRWATCPRDTWHYHFFDTVKGSDWLGRTRDAIEFMCREAPKVVYELEHFGMPFDRNPDGTIYQRPFGGHTANYGEKPVQRACAAADRTGHAMLHTLYQQNVKARTNFFVEWMALDLIMDAEGDVLGVHRAGDGNRRRAHPRGEVHAVRHRRRRAHLRRQHQRLHQHRRRPGHGGARGRAAGRHGVSGSFHPTGVHNAGVLLTEGCRGEGAILRNSSGERFMERYAPTLKDLAPRDFVSRCMDQENQGKGAAAVRTRITSSST